MTIAANAASNKQRIPPTEIGRREYKIEEIKSSGY
jgi:hypothetical protein